MTRWAGGRFIIKCFGTEYLSKDLAQAQVVDRGMINCAVTAT